MKLFKKRPEKKFVMGSRTIPELTSNYYVLKFGKYKGHTVAWILQNNPSYIIWLAHKELVKVNPKIYTAAQALYEKECELKTKAYSHLNHNYSSYYDEEYGNPDDWVEQYGSSIWD